MLKKLDIAPLSVNLAYRGRRFKTNDHKQFEIICTALLNQLKLKEIPPKTGFYVIYRFHISSASDWDNCIKVFQDLLCKCLKTDDRYISAAYVQKRKAKKKEEKIEFQVFDNEEDHFKAIQEMQS